MHPGRRTNMGIASLVSQQICREGCKLTAKGRVGCVKQVGIHEGHSAAEVSEARRRVRERQRAPRVAARRVRRRVGAGKGEFSA